MLRFLFPRLTAEPARGAELFRWVVGETRAPHWYVAGGMADTVDGRFAMLATIAALVMVRIERDGDSDPGTAAALTERFVEAMIAEHREMGLGDPTLGRTVRKLVGALARRVELWRSAISRDGWVEAARTSAYGGQEPSAAALAHTVAGLRDLWLRLAATPVDAIAGGRIE
jgi:cytochrome b pre-mRNA-processing protein 3